MLKLTVSPRGDKTSFILKQLWYQRHICIEWLFTKKADDYFNKKLIYEKMHTSSISVEENWKKTKQFQNL